MMINFFKYIKPFQISIFSMLVHETSLGKLENYGFKPVRQEHLSYEKVWVLQHGEEKAPEKPYSTFQYLKGLQGSWRGTFVNGVE